MSIRPWNCETCKKPCNYLGLQLFSGQDDGVNYGVGWGCPTCDYKALDVCPLGPLLPDPEVCLNCGGNLPAGKEEPACPGCGLTPTAALPFLRLSAMPPPDPAAAARDQFGRGLFRRGLAILNQALAKDVGQESAWLLKCSFLEGVGLQRLMIPMIEGALALGAPHSLLINHGSALHQAGRYQEAANASRRYLEEAPEGPWAGAARTNLGVSLRMLGDDASAEELYRQAIQLEPNQPLHYRNLGQLLMDQRRWAGALGAMEAGLERAASTEDRIRFLEAITYVYAEEGRGEPSLRSIEQAIALGAATARTHYLRGRALALVGRLEEAREEMARVLEIDPENEDAPRAREILEEALKG